MDRPPLVVFDTNILVDIWLARDGNVSALLLELAERGDVELVIPEYVLIEFRGFALRWLRDERAKLDQRVRAAAREWRRSEQLDEGAELIAQGCDRIERRLEVLRAAIDQVTERIEAVSRVAPHTQEIHFRGDLRFLAGKPPDQPVTGLEDCRIYEAILDIASADHGVKRSKIIVTKDHDFDHDELRAEIDALGFVVRSDPGRLYGELRQAAAARPR